MAEVTSVAKWGYPLLWVSELLAVDVLPWLSENSVTTVVLGLPGIFRTVALHFLLCISAYFALVGGYRDQDYTLLLVLQRAFHLLLVDMW